MVNVRPMRASMLACVLLVAGCSGNDSSPGSGSSPNTTYTGGFTGSGNSIGTLSVVFPPAPPQPLSLGDSAVTVSGEIHVVGAGTVPLEGTFVSPSGPLDLSGGGYVLTGAIDATGALRGSWTGPSAGGRFAAVTEQNGWHVLSYCGGYSGGDVGTVSLIERGPAYVGTYSGLAMAGDISGEDRYDDEAVLHVYLELSTGGTATGTYNYGLPMTGTWDTATLTGTWGVNANACD